MDCLLCKNELASTDELKGKDVCYVCQSSLDYKEKAKEDHVTQDHYLELDLLPLKEPRSRLVLRWCLSVAMGTLITIEVIKFFLPYLSS